MDTDGSAKEIDLIFKKIRQVLRIKETLERRRADSITYLRSCNDKDTTLKYLENLLEIYKRELRIIELCKKGLQNAEIILENVEKEFGKGLIFSTSLRIFASRAIPFSQKFISNDMIAVDLIRLMNGDLINAINTMNEQIVSIEKKIFEQYKYINKQVEKDRIGDLLANITWEDSFYNEFEKAHKEELNIIEEIKKSWNRKIKFRLLRRAQQLNEALRKNPKLSKAQPIIYLLTSSLVSWPVSLYFLKGPTIFLGVACFAAVRQCSLTLLGIKIAGSMKK